MSKRSLLIALVFGILAGIGMYYVATGDKENGYSFTLKDNDSIVVLAQSKVAISSAQPFSVTATETFRSKTTDYGEQLLISEGMWTYHGSSATGLVLTGRANSLTPGDRLIAAGFMSLIIGAIAGVLCESLSS